MESSSDKQLRDKLSSTEFPFDPAAWGQMEAMLNEKKKRRGFFWWWTGGIAAAFLLVLFGYELREIVGERERSEIRNQKSESAITMNELPVSENENSKGQFENGRLEKETNNKTEKSETKNHNPASSTTAEAGQSQEGTGNGSMVLIKEHSTNQGHHSTLLDHSGKRVRVISKKKHNELALQKFTSEESTTGYLTKEENPFKKEIEMLNAASAKNTVDLNITLSRKEASLLETVSENAEAGFDKKESEDLLPKKKKQVFNYSLGVLANVTGTTLGSQIFSDQQRNRPPLFNNQPSYMVGFTHDFLFANRVAITNSIIFSQTSFKVYSPKTVSFSKVPNDYTSNITELVIPIGIKVYPVVKNNFRFYINAGIINHIKLKETFSYTMPGDTVSPSTLGVASLADVNANPPTETFFSRTSGSTEPLNTNDFSVNKAKRYYTSFYASAGFEFVAKKHFILFTEPMFYMSLQKIGVQEKHKYNLGLTAGFRYQF